MPGGISRRASESGSSSQTKGSCISNVDAVEESKEVDKDEHGQDMQVNLANRGMLVDARDINLILRTGRYARGLLFLCGFERLRRSKGFFGSVSILTTTAAKELTFLVDRHLLNSQIPFNTPTELPSPDVLLFIPSVLLHNKILGPLLMNQG